MDENVVVFPRGYGSPEPESLDDIRERMENIREVFIDASVEELMQCVAEAIEAAGYDLDYEAMGKDTALLAMSIKSLLMKSKNIHHPMQDIAEDSFTATDDGYICLKENVGETGNS